MKPYLKSVLNNLPKLSRANPFQSSKPCKICGGKSHYFDSVDFFKYCAPDNYFEFGVSGIFVDYWHCATCGFIFTPFFDEWSDSDFRQFIYNEDYIKVDGEYARIRPEHVAEDFAGRLAGCAGARILDYGSGAGFFVSRMRDHGFGRIEGYDPFSSPEKPFGLFDIITCFEVIEHSPDPAATLADMKRYLKPDGCIIFSQTVHPDDIMAIRGSWWYLAPRNGHVSTYSEEALLRLGARHALRLHYGSNVYAFAPAHPSSFAQLALSRVGPSFALVRAFAPRQVVNRDICFPTPNDVCWHQTERDGLWRFRWTSNGPASWEISWPPVELVEVRVPYLKEAEPGFAGRCELELDGCRAPTRVSRGELAALFQVRERSSGVLTLITPEPTHFREDQDSGRQVGLAIKLGPDPLLPLENAA